MSCPLSLHVFYLVGLNMGQVCLTLYPPPRPEACGPGHLAGSLAGVASLALCQGFLSQPCSPMTWAQLLTDIDESQRVEVTQQALQTLPEENYQVLRFLTAFLVQVRPTSASTAHLGVQGGGRGSCSVSGTRRQDCGFLMQSLIPSTDFCPL